MSTLRLTTISNQGGTDSVPSQTVISGSAKAWVNFNGTGTVAIRQSFNVSSITDNGTGTYTVNFTTALADVNYVVTTGANGDNDYTTTGTDRNNYPLVSASSCTIRTRRVTDQSAQDNAFVTVAFFR
jgi:hypothetical protein